MAATLPARAAAAAPTAGLRPARLGREEWFMVAIAIAAFAFSNLPRLWAALHVPPGEVYIGTVWAGPDEAWMIEAVRQGMAGHLLSSARAVGAPAGFAYFHYPPYVLLGALLGWTGATPIDVLGWIRVLLEAVALGAAGLFVRAALPPGRRAWGYFFAVLAGGLGFLFAGTPATPLGPAIPADLNQPSFNVLNSLHMQPIVAWDLAGICLFGWGFLAALAGRRRAWLGLVGVAMSATAHPMELLPALLGAGVTAIWLARRSGVIAYLAGAAVVAVPYQLYLLLALSSGSLLGMLHDTASTEVQTLPSVLLASAFVWPLVAVGARRGLLERDPSLVFCLAWLVPSLVLGLAPMLASSQLHRTLEGRSLVMGVLAAQGVVFVAARWRAWLVGACLITPLLQVPLLVWWSQNDSSLYLRRDDLALAAQMDRAGTQGAVLGTNLTMTWVASYSQTRVAFVWGPGDDDVAALVRGAPADRAALLRRDGADYLVWGGREEKLFGPPPPGLRVVMRAGDSYLLGPP